MFIFDVWVIWWALECMISVGQEVVFYNMEIVEVLYWKVCLQAKYY